MTDGWLSSTDTAENPSDVMRASSKSGRVLLMAPPPSVIESPAPRWDSVIRPALSQIKLAARTPKRAQCPPSSDRNRRAAVTTPSAPLKACVHYDAQARSCSKCSVRLVSVCAVLSPGELHEMEAMSRGMRVAAREVLASQGSPGDSVFTITEGVVRIYKLLADGRRQVLGFAWRFPRAVAL